MDWGVYIAVAAAPLAVFYSLLTGNRSRERLQNGPLYSLKWLISWGYVHLYHRSDRSRIRINNETSEALHLLRLLPSPLVENLEKPQDLSLCIASKAMDSMYLSGRDDNGNSILLGLARCSHRRTEVWLMLGLGDRGDFQLPLHPDTNVYNVSESGFGAKGLSFQVLEPMHRWRICFNGMLRKVSSGLKFEETEIIPVQFSFIWTAFTEPFEYQARLPPSLWADAVADNFWSGQEFENIHRFIDNRYEQWGQLKGTVCTEGQEDLELHLRGRRQRVFGCSNWQDINRQMEVEAYITDGTLIHLGAVMLKNGPARLQYGSLNEASGAVSPISWCNLVPEETLEKSMVIQFDAGGQTLLMNMNITDPMSTLYNGKLWCNQTVVFRVAFDYNGKSGIGWATVTSRNIEESFVAQNRSSLFIIPEMLSKDEDHALVMPYNRKECCQANLVGGKGASLAVLNLLHEKLECGSRPWSRSNKTSSSPLFQVPKAMCVTAKAFIEHLSVFSAVQQAISQMEDVAWKKKDGSLKDECQRVVKILTGTSLSSCIQSAITGEFLKMFKDYKGTFAVRSSAIGEDSEDTSAAGQHETYLGIKDLGEIYESVVKCWASQFTYAAVEYKRQRGQLLNPGMGVVIQEMVDADVAGVMFTNDPVTGNPSTVTITANFGLAESVVSASAEPDTVLLKRTYDDNLSVRKILVGTKKHKIIISEEGGTVELAVNEKMGSSCCVPEDLALEMGAVGIALEQIMGYPQDVEWAVKNGSLYLLQARPITSFGKANDFELTHELDSPMRTDHEISTTANTGEVFPNATSPLTISTVVRCLDVGIRNNIMKRNSSVGFCPYDFGKQLVMTHNRVLINCIDLMCRDSPGHRPLSSRVMELSVYGHVLDDITMYQIAGERYSRCKSNNSSFLIQLMMDLWRNKARLQKMSQAYQDFTVDATPLLSCHVYDNINNILPKVVQCMLSHSLVTTASAFWNIVAVITLTENNEEWSESLYTDIATLLSTCSDVESADVPTAMRDIADVILKEPEHKEFSELDTESALRWLQSHGQNIKATFEEFIKKHGHRCLKEFDVYSKSWRMDPSSVIAILQKMVKNPTKLGSKKESVSIKGTLQKLKTPKSRITKWILGWILPRYRAAVGYREQSKSILIKVIDQLRQGYNVLATRMVNEGRLPDAELIFFLTHAEIGQLLYTRSPKLLIKAAHRKRLHRQLDKLSFNEIIVGIPKPLSVAAESKTNSQSTIIAGTPVCNGETKGVARVIKTLDNASEIQAGDILITYSTDIGWSPYFPLLSGVVTEIGGILSHGAVVAREYGLPCIVGAHNATALCNSGDVVVLNGSKGTLVIEERVNSLSRKE